VRISQQSKSETDPWPPPDPPLSTMNRIHSQNLPSRLLRLLGGFPPSGHSAPLIWGWTSRSASVSQDTINIDQIRAKQGGCRRSLVGYKSGVAHPIHLILTNDVIHFKITVNKIAIPYYEDSSGTREILIATVYSQKFVLRNDINTRTLIRPLLGNQAGHINSIDHGGRVLATEIISSRDAFLDSFVARAW
jgi:hypothetical protein